MLIIWTTGLLFSMTSLGDTCVVGIVGESAVLPCIYNGTYDLDSGSVSIEWRTGIDVVHTSVLGKDRKVVRSILPRNKTRLISDVIQGGDISLVMSDVTLRDARSYNCYVSQPEGKASTPLCTVCLSVAAHFTHPVVLREDDGEGEEAHFFCHSRGGFPEPTVHWLIDDTEHPLVATVRTYSSLLPVSELYNITSVLSVNLTHDITVSCAIENRVLNENLTSAGVGVQTRPMVGRASEAMWMFSTALCVVVGILVVAAVAYQLKQDYDSKKTPQQQQQQEIRDKGRSSGDERERIILEHLNSLTETNV